MTAGGTALLVRVSTRWCERVSEVVLEQDGDPVEVHVRGGETAEELAWAAAQTEGWMEQDIGLVHLLRAELARPLGGRAVTALLSRSASDVLSHRVLERDVRAKRATRGPGRHSSR